MRLLSVDTYTITIIIPYYDISISDLFKILPLL